jgi:hypothetical protein
MNMTINDNIIEHNGEICNYGECAGIWIYSSDPDYISGNSFYNNTFNNTANIITDNNSGNINSWNSSSGGNFWAYPNGTGYSQICDNLNNDSFCDSSYIIGSSDTDYLPLTTNYTYTYDTTPPNIEWNTPSNNSFTLNSSEIDWNVSLDESPNVCIININGSNTTMDIDGLYCYYNILNLTNATTYCAEVYANDSVGNLNLSTTQCATINLTSTPTIPPTPKLIDNLGQFGFIGAIAIGAGILMFLIDAFLGDAMALLKDPKKLITIIIGAIIMVAIFSVLF